MAYGSSSYGSIPIGGNLSSQWQTFFSYHEYAAGSYEARAVLLGSDPFYSVFLYVSGEPNSVEAKIYTYNDPDETPQLQVTIGGAIFSQAVIGRALFILVVVTLGGADFFRVIGRDGD